jgi:hypothetical protein
LAISTLPIHLAAASLLLIAVSATGWKVIRRLFPRWLRARSGCFFRLLSFVLINHCGHFAEDLIPDPGLASASRHAADAELQ